MAFTDLSYFVGQGVLYAAPRVMNGAMTGGYIDLGDVDQFTIDPKQTFEDIEESRTGYGFTAAHVPTTTKLNVKMRIMQPSMANWERAVWGTYTGAVTGGSASEALTIYPNSMLPLLHPGVSSVTVSAGVEGTDYTVDATNGAIVSLAGSTVFDDVAGVAVTVAYDFDTYTGAVEAFTVKQPIFSLRLHAINTANSAQPTIVQVYQWAPDVTNMLELISKKHMALEVNGMVLQDQTRALPTAADPFSQFFRVARA